MRFKSKKGFTLIELLVAVAVIGVLVSIVFGSLSDSRLKARDSARLLSTRAIQNALELYYLDHNEYPRITDFSSVGFGFTSNCNHSIPAGAPEIVRWNDFMTVLSPYLPAIEQPPANETWPRCIYYIDQEYSFCNPGQENYQYILLVGADPNIHSPYSFPQPDDTSLARHCFYSPK